MDPLSFKFVESLTYVEVITKMNTFFVDSIPSRSESEHNMSSDVEDKDEIVYLSVSKSEEEDESVLHSEFTETL